MPNVILVDKNDQQIGTCEKLEAHQKGLLHRAFSIFIFNDKQELLLQQRAAHKYHSGSLWTNTVCSHPRPDQDINKEAQQRLIDEMGFTTKIKEIHSFYYKSDYENGLTEHEFDHVFIGIYNKNPKPNPEEAMNFKWITIPELLADIKQSPENYTSWFKILMDNQEFIQKLKSLL